MNPTPINPIKKVLYLIEQAGLLLILLATIVAIGQEMWSMIESMHVQLADLLMLFIYLEVLAMVGIYYESHRIPVRFPLYIAMIALARYIILDSKAMSAGELLAVGGTMLLIASTILIVRFGHCRYPYGEKES